MKSDILPITLMAPVGALATVNADGTPWVTPLHVAVDEEMAVWLSSETTQHGQNIARDSRISLTLWSNTEVENVKGVYIQSRAEIVTGAKEIAARQLYARRFGVVPEKFLAAETYIAPLGDINTTKTRGGRLYFNG